MLEANRQLILDLIWSVLFVAAVYGAKGGLLRLMHSKIANTTTFYRAKRIINAVTFFAVALVLLIKWLNMGGSLLTFLGLFSAGVALALKDILLNLVAWIYILVKQPFSVGDRIEISGIKGDVIDQNIFKFRVVEIGNWVQAEQSTGRIIHIPNYKIFTDPLANYSLGFEYIWDEIAVTVTFESDWKKAKRLLTTIVEAHSEDVSEAFQKALRETSRKYMIYYHNLSPIVYTDVIDIGVRLTMRFLCSPKERRNKNEEIWENVLETFSKESDLDFAYPTIRRVE
ncbi:MAG: hypothetical protein PWQ12_261 [Clostridiales bacterium]|jgi:small-conductance mechanosensitive channel|nr:hypothetical protein [Clostridiales bacterium]